MNFTKSCCNHKFDKSSLSTYICKNCSTIQLNSIPLVLKKKNNDIFCKPYEYCYNYEINIIELIKNKIKDDENNFRNYKKELEKIENINDTESNNYEKDIEESSEVSSSDSENTNNDNCYLYSFNIYYKNRKKILSHIKKLCNKHKATKNCLFLTLELIEKFFLNYEKKHINNYQMDLIINAIFILAYKFIDTDSDYYLCYKSFKTFFSKRKKHLRAKDLRVVEVQCLKILEYNLSKFTIFNFLELVLSSGIVLEKEVFNFKIISKIYNECFNLLDFCFEENDLIMEYPINQIVFSIIYIIRKQNNLVYNIEKNFQKIYNIELKKYLNCIKYISSIYYKNENISNNFFLLNDDRKKVLFINDKKSEDDKVENLNFDSKNILNFINNQNENKKLKLNDSKEINIKINMKKNPFIFSKSKSLDLSDIKKIKNKFNENSKENIDNLILLESEAIHKLKENDKNILKPINLNFLHNSRNLGNLRYKNVFSNNNNSSISTYNNSNNNNNDIKIKTNKNSSNHSSVDINKNEYKYLNYLKDSLNSVNSLNTHNKKIFKVKSCQNIFEDNTNVSKSNHNLINSFRKNYLNKSDIKVKLFNDKEIHSKLKLNYNFNNKNNNEHNINNEENNIFKIINKLKDNSKIKLPIIKK